MKLLIIHNKYRSDNMGGEDIVYKNELESLQARLGEENVLFYEVSNDDINKFRLLFEIWFSFRHYRNVKKIVHDNGVDIVHVHNFFPLLTPSVFKAAKDSGAKVVHTLHNYRLWCISGILYRDGYGICEVCTTHTFSFNGIVNKCYRKSWLQSFVAQGSFWFYKATRVFENIDYFFVLTNFQKEKIKALGIDEQKIRYKPNSLKISFGGQKEKQDYVYVGRLEESKGIYELLHIWKQLDARFVLRIIGSGQMQEALQKEFAQANIIFSGKQTHEATLQSIACAKYLIQPSILYETFGLTIIEAMSFGVPVIGFHIGTRGDFIQDNVNGFLSNRDNLKEVLEKSYHYPGYETLSEKALESAKIYENSYVVEKQIEMYREILEHTT